VGEKVKGEEVDKNTLRFLELIAKKAME